MPSAIVRLCDRRCGGRRRVLAARPLRVWRAGLLIESGGPTTRQRATRAVWFYNGEAPLYHLPITPVPQLNNRTFNMASVTCLARQQHQCMVWSGTVATTTGGRERARGGPSPTCIPVFKSQEDWESGANDWRGAGGPIHIPPPRHPHITAPAFLDAAARMACPPGGCDGPLRSARLINMNSLRWDSRSAARAFLHPALVETTSVCCSTPTS